MKKRLIGYLLLFLVIICCYSFNFSKVGDFFVGFLIGQLTSVIIEYKNQYFQKSMGLLFLNTWINLAIYTIVIVIMIFTVNIQVYLGFGLQLLLSRFLLYKKIMAEKGNGEFR